MRQKNYIKLKKYSLITFSVLISLFLLKPVHAETASLDTTFVNGDQYSANFATNLNRNFTQILNALNNVRGSFTGTLPANNSQIGTGTIGVNELADEANPQVRFNENWGSYIETGLVPQTSANLNSTITAGTAYVEGYKIN